MSSNSPLTTIIFVLIGIGVSAFATYTYLQKELDTRTATVYDRVIEAEQTLITLANEVDRGVPNQAVRGVVSDCRGDRRNRFDSLLGQLDNLAGADLVELQNLFSQCGHYFSTEKSVLALQLNREVQVYIDTVTLWGDLTGEALERYQLDKWQSLAAAESKQSMAYTSLVRLQGQIIDARVSGSVRGSDEINALLAEVSEVQDTIAVQGIQIKQQREALFDV